MAYINLYRIPEIDMNYENIPWFERKTQQDQWMLSKRQVQLEGKISVDPNRTSVTIAMSYAEIERLNVDYCSLTDQSGKILYYFIADYDYKTSNATTLILELDVFQTYMFDVQYGSSFIDRAHIDRWQYSDNGELIPNIGFTEIEEGLQYGDYHYHTQNEYVELPDQYIITSTEPLGVNDWKRPQSGGGGGTPSLGKCWQEGKVSADLFRLAKGFEGFGPRIYADSGGVLTIGYGTTQDDIVAWNKLTKVQPCKEEEAAQLAYESFNKNYGAPIKDFVIKNFGVDNQNKFDALTDLCYNAGPGRVTKGDLCEILKKYPNDEAKVRPVWESWIIRDQFGNIQKGLIDRRKAECDMYFHGKYEKRDISIVDTNGRPTGEIVKDGGWLPSDCAGEVGGEIPDIDSMKAFTAYGKKFIYPLQGGRSSISSKLGWRIHPIHGTQKFHNGDDIGCPLNEPIYASHDAKVVLADGTSDPNGYGNWIILQNDELKIQTYYAHCNKLLVKPGQTVKAGQKIALAGTTGGSTGVHLHYELRNKPYGKADVVDPLPHLKAGAIL